MKAKEMHYFSNLFDKVLYTFRTVELSETCRVLYQINFVGFHDKNTSRRTALWMSKKDLALFWHVQTGTGDHQTPIQWVPEFSFRLNLPGMTLTTHHYLAPSLKMVIICTSNSPRRTSQCGQGQIHYLHFQANSY